MSGPGGKRGGRAPARRPLGALIVPAAVWALGMGAYVLADRLIEDRAIALIFAALLLVTLAPLAAGGARRGQA